MVIVQRTGAEQLDAVLDLVDRLLYELSGDALSAFTRQDVQGQLIGAKDQFIAFLATDDGVPVGVLTLSEAVAAYAGGRYGIISEVYVAPTHRGTGIGHRLIDAAIGEARTRGWRRLDVSAPPDAQWDRTFAFYVNSGFVFTGRKLKLLVTS